MSFEIENGILKKYNQEDGVTDVIIPEGVTSIWVSAFDGCSNLTSITIPKGVTSIGAYSLRGCSNLTSITIPEGVTSIGWSAFEGCSDLASITIPEGVTEIGSSVFEGCEGLVSITIPEGVTSIDDDAFGGCSGLTSITIPESVTSIGLSAFRGCSGLKSIIIPEGVTSIWGSAFKGCSGLVSITIPKGVTRIGVSAFKGCSGLKYINILGNPTISDNSFDDSDGLFVCFTQKYSNTVEFAENYQRIGIAYPNYNFENETKTNIKKALVRGFIERMEEYQEEDIRHQYFKYISRYRKDWLPMVYAKDRYEIIEAIAKDGKIDIDNYEDFWAPVADTEAVECKVFLLNWKAKNITSEMESRKFEKELNKDPFNVKDMQKLWKYETKADGTIKLTDCKKKDVASVIVPNHIGKKDVTEIGENTFKNCKQITDLIIPDSVTSIGRSAFNGCSGLKSITIPEGVTSIGGRAFYDCSNLTSITIPNSVTSIGSGAFGGCSGLTIINVEEGNPKYYAINNCLIEKETKSLVWGCKNSIIPTDDSVTSIGKYAFSYCSGLVSITIPKGVTSIGEGAFSYCGGLVSITIPESVTSIGEYAFEYCSEQLTIYTKRWSKAERYAKKHYIKVVV